MKRPRIAVLAVALGLAGTVAMESLQRGRDALLQHQQLTRSRPTPRARQRPIL